MHHIASLFIIPALIIAHQPCFRTVIITHVNAYTRGRAAGRFQSRMIAEIHRALLNAPTNATQNLPWDKAYTAHVRFSSNDVDFADERYHEFDVLEEFIQAAGQET